MNPRLVLALILFAGPLAFAPAPLPRRARGQPEEMTLASFQGSWRFVRDEVSLGGGRFESLAPTEVTHVRITGDRWVFLPCDYPHRTSFVAIDSASKPALLRFYDFDDPLKERVAGVGLIRRKGTQVQVLYRWGGEENRASDFDSPPKGHWRRTLERDEQEAPR